MALLAPLLSYIIKIYANGRNMATSEQMSGRIHSGCESQAHPRYYQAALKTNRIDTMVFFEARVFHGISMSENLVKELLQKRIRNNCTVMVDITEAFVPRNSQEQSEVESARLLQSDTSTNSSGATYIVTDSHAAKTRAKTDPETQANLTSILQELDAMFNSDESLLKTLAYYLCLSGFCTEFSSDRLKEICSAGLFEYITFFSSLESLNVLSLIELCGTRWKADTARKTIRQVLSDMQFNILLNN